MSPTGRVLAPGQLKFLESGKLLISPSQEHNRDQQEAETVSSQLSLRNERPCRGSLGSTVNFPRCREGVKRWEREASTQHWPQACQGSADSLPAGSLCSQPGREHKLAADLFADGLVGQQAVTPALRTVLTPHFGPLLAWFWLTPNLRFSRAGVEMDKDRCQTLLWHFKYDHGIRTGLSQYPLLVWMYS